MLTSQTVSILFWNNKSKIRNGKAPIYCRVSVYGKRVEIATGKFIEPENWQSGKVTSKTEESKTINKYLILMENELYSKASDLSYRGEHISAEKIRNLYKGVGKNEKMFLVIFKDHNDKMKEMIGNGVAKGTHTKFSTIYSKVENYIATKYRLSDISIYELNHQFVVGFEHYLKVVHHMGQNTTMKYIQALKKLMNICVANEWLMKNPFGNFKCPITNPEREVLLEHEIEKIESKTFFSKRLDEVRDTFLFCCYTGLAFIDVYKLTTNELLMGIDGHKWIFTSRQKTKIKSSIPLLPPALKILQKYENHGCRVVKNKLLPVKSNQKMNDYLKEIADICEITKPLSMHIARHTFATTMTLSNGVPIETVSKMLGHTKLSTTQIYAKVIENKVSEDMKNLRLKLEKKSVNNKTKSLKRTV
ncbi:MAG: site-specific integrase [Bacteroidota bacterium]